MATHFFGNQVRKLKYVISVRTIRRDFYNVMILFNYNESLELTMYLLYTYLILDGLINLLDTMSGFD